MAIVQEWLEHGCAESIEQIERIMVSCIRPYPDAREKEGT